MRRGRTTEDEKGGIFGQDALRVILMNEPVRVCVTERRHLKPADVQPAGELAPSLALPWIAKLRYGMLAGFAALILAAHFAFQVELPAAWLAVPLALTAVSNVLLGRLVAPSVRGPHWACCSRSTRCA